MDVSSNKPGELPACRLLVFASCTGVCQHSLFGNFGVNVDLMIQRAAPEDVECALNRGAEIVWCC